MAINPDALRNALALLLRSPALPRIELDAGAAQLPERSPGDRVQARVIAELTNGRALIDIEGRRFDVKLPVAAGKGEMLRLQVLALEPRLTFGLLADSAAASRGVSMSPAVRELTALIEQLATGTRSTTPAQSAAPVLPSPPADTAAFAESLRTALARSGLFYESHQARWVAGELGLDELVREPQATLGPTGDAVHPESVGIVRQQLEALETRQVVWNGPIWPDQTLEWRIEEESRECEADGETAPPWKTSLRLTLPRLGEITAQLGVTGNVVHLAFSDVSPETATTMRSGEAALREAFGKAGLTLAAFDLKPQ